MKEYDDVLGEFDIVADLRKQPMGVQLWLRIRLAFMKANVLQEGLSFDRPARLADQLADQLFRVVARRIQW